MLSSFWTWVTHIQSVSGLNPTPLLSRTVTAGPVSPVSTRPFFPPLVVCLALPISATARRTPTQRPEAQRYHVETCKIAANSVTKLFCKSSFQRLSALTIRLHLRRVGLSANKQTRSESRHHWCTTQRAEWYSYETVVWPAKSIVLAQKWSQKQSHSP